MFNNIGKKNKLIAQIIFPLDVLFSIIFAIICFANIGLDAIFILYGFLSLIFGPIVAWIFAIIVYSFGTIVDNVQAIKDAQSKETTEDPSLWQLLKNFFKKNSKDNSKETEKLTEQLTSGKITFEEYNKAVDKDQV